MKIERRDFDVVLVYAFPIIVIRATPYGAAYSRGWRVFQNCFLKWGIS